MLIGDNMTTREKIEVMEAYDRGEEIQILAEDGIKFEDMSLEPRWDWYNCEYRIKPKEKKLVTVYEYMYQVKSTNRWTTLNILYKNDDEARKEWKSYKIQKTGREFQVEEY